MKVVSELIEMLCRIVHRSAYSRNQPADYCQFPAGSEAVQSCTDWLLLHTNRGEAPYPKRAWKRLATCGAGKLRDGVCAMNFGAVKS